MALVKGPFTVEYADKVIADVTEVTFNYDVDSNDYSTIDGRTTTVPGAITASVEVTLLDTTPKVLGALLPQYLVQAGDKLSTGETVSDADGAIDLVAAQCDTEDFMSDLTVTSCNGQIVRLVNAKPSLTGIEIADNAVRQATVTFTAQPEQNQASVQFYTQGGINQGQSS